MDEPTSNLDLYYQFQIMSLLKELSVTERFTTLLSLHQIDLVARFSDKVIVINDGCVYDYGTPEEILTAQMFRDVYRMNTEIVNKGGTAYVIPISQHHCCPG
jgi:iron complex transport system ATP-binding protein